MRYEITIPGKPYPLKRHRVVGKRHYDPQSNLKASVRYYARTLENMPKRLTSPLFVKIRLNIPIPKSYSKKKALKHLGLPHTSKPDLSNLIKFYEDTFNKMFWDDDAIIAA